MNFWHYLTLHDAVAAGLLGLSGVALTLARQEVERRQARRDDERRERERAEREQAAERKKAEEEARKAEEEARRADRAEAMRGAELSNVALAATVERLTGENSRLYNENQRLNAIIDVLHKMNSLLPTQELFPQVIPPQGAIPAPMPALNPPGEHFNGTE